MGTGRTDEYRKDAVRIALTSGLSRRQVALPIGPGEPPILCARVIPPFLTGSSRRIQAAVFNFIAGVIPPIPILGRSLL